ncbi:DUF2970 domain-containing protein [Photobacterium chitinilyticum]|uniref:DUF2970 domain-containing protein n=1 Tax=Photobacterium chitinilyticum TaxID=2485123 RepID=A0A444JMW2_9GAMM|nr:DUF2970 domain-containing protein [Photobacterium chitinilyticum]RWX54433.1 DUF2970 domain-containing protein [Photobacterium chitinilyticum]
MEKQNVGAKKRSRDRQGSLALSIAAALFGVQSERNRQHDFNQRTPWPFIVAGIVGILLFIGLLVAITLIVTATHGR